MQDNTQNKAFHISSYDFDGCLLHLGTKNYLNDVIEENRTLFNATVAQNKKYKINIGLIGSNRQDQYINELNRKSKEKKSEREFKRHQESPFSAFNTTKKFVEQTGSDFNPLLLADVYSSQHHGAAFDTAVDEDADDDTFHQRYIFDEYKLSLLYMQIHQASINARGCDFIVLDNVGIDTIPSIPKQSNAAYVYRETDKILYYINSMEDICVKVSDHSSEAVETLLHKYHSPDLVEKSQCFTRTLNENEIFGFSLNDDEINTITTTHEHLHNFQDYPIVFDFYDDRRDILAKLNKFFGNNKNLIPKNVILRLHHYDKDSRDYLNDVYSVIAGTGNINPDPANFFRTILQEREKSNTDVYCTERKNIGHISEILQRKDTIRTLQASATLEPNCDVEESIHRKDLVQDHATYTTIERLRNHKIQPSPAGFSEQEVETAIDFLCSALEEPTSKIDPKWIPVLRQGAIGTLVEKLELKVESYALKDAKAGNLSDQQADKINLIRDYPRRRNEITGAQTKWHGFGIEKNDKFAAAEAVITAITRGNSYVDAKHQKALSQGTLKEKLDEIRFKPIYVTDANVLSEVSTYQYVEQFVEKLYAENYISDKSNRIFKIASEHLKQNPNNQSSLNNYLKAYKMVDQQLFQHSGLRKTLTFILFLFLIGLITVLALGADGRLPFLVNWIQGAIEGISENSAKAVLGAAELLPGLASVEILLEARESYYRPGSSALFAEPLPEKNELKTIIEAVHSEHCRGPVVDSVDAADANRTSQSQLSLSATN
jgi:hypothetical protein